MQGLTRFHFTLNHFLIVLLELKWWWLYLADSFALISSQVIRKRFIHSEKPPLQKTKVWLIWWVFVVCLFLSRLEVFQLVSGDQVNVFLQQVSKHVALCPQKRGGLVGIGTGGGGGGGRRKSEWLDRALWPRMTEEAADHRQNNSYVRAVGASPLCHCVATSVLHNCCFNCCVEQSLSVALLTVTITIYFINPSGKLKLSFDCTTKNIAQ